MHTGPENVRAESAASEIRSVSFVSLGCPKNLVDSEKMLGLLAEDGIAVVSGGGSGDFDNADAVVVNTCGFLEASKDESLGVIQEALRAKEAGSVKRVVVAGCLVQRHRAKMLEWAPGVDALIGVFDRDRIVEAVRGRAPVREAPDAAEGPRYWIAANALVAAKERGQDTVGLTVNGKDGKGIGYFEDDSARLRITPRHYAYLRISEGCNQNCAFCTIPSIRGKMRSKPLERIVAEARELIADGAFELNLIGQDTTSYGDDLGIGMGGSALRADGHHGSESRATGGNHGSESRATGMPGMLAAVNRAFDEAGVKDGWVRLMYAYPTNFSDEMIEAIAHLSQKGRIVPYIDIPLQHASDNMLTAMRRNVSAAHQRELMLKLRERIPGMSIRTTFITGFPGETEADHQQLLEFIEEIGFDAMGVFRYSPEDGTVAGRMAADPALAVPADVVERRYDELMSLQQQIAFEQAAYLAEQFDENDAENTGARFDVLIDRRTATTGRATTGVSGAGQIHEGRTYFQAPQIDAVTYVHSTRELAPGELVRCVVTGSDGYDLIARPVEEVTPRRGVSLNILR